MYKNVLDTEKTSLVASLEAYAGREQEPRVSCEEFDLDTPAILSFVHF